MLKYVLCIVASIFLLTVPAFSKDISCANPERDTQTLIAIAGHPHEGAVWKTRHMNKTQAALLVAAYKADAVKQGEQPLPVEPSDVYLSRLYMNGDFRGSMVVFSKDGCFIFAVQINEGCLQRLLGRPA